MDNIDPALLEHNNDAHLQMANIGSIIGISPNKVLKTDEHSAKVNMTNSEKMCRTLVLLKKLKGRYEL